MEKHHWNIPCEQTDESKHLGIVQNNSEGPVLENSKKYSKQSRGKVMFSQVSVRHSLGGNIKCFDG